jgi:hypothetical protein
VFLLHSISHWVFGLSARVPGDEPRDARGERRLDPGAAHPRSPPDLADV